MPKPIRPKMPLVILYNVLLYCTNNGFTQYFVLTHFNTLYTRFILANISIEWV